ncbi:amino acid permease [Ancylostoma ceylanicum]|uniref:Amino acid permease n=2 Tax=Ancylostoma TaxID=29169 RepID=A0A0D6L9E4_9BILA|nr:amino acid permease [Ancylostoma ceylanicum]
METKLSMEMDDTHKLGFLGATSYVIGNIIGSGIFITPASILRCTDSVGLSLVIWVACALIAILGALVYIELGTSIREAGCDFAYICYVKWYSIAFSFMFVSVLMTYPATIAIIAETFGQYLIEGLKQVYEIDDDWAPLAQKLFGFSLLLLVTWMNFFSLNKFAARFQIVATVAKLLSCFLIIVTGLYYYYVKGWKSNLRDPMKGSNYKAGDLILGFYGGLWAYSGWDVLNYSTGEIANPRRNVPLALLSGIATVTAVYVSINVAYFVALDVETVKSSNAVAALFSQATLGSFANLIPFLIGVLLVGSLNSNLFSGSRYMYAAARQGHLPTCFSCVNTETDSPRVAIIAQHLRVPGDHRRAGGDPYLPGVLGDRPRDWHLPHRLCDVLCIRAPQCAANVDVHSQRVVFDCLPDLKPGVGSAFLPTSDSSQALLPKRCSSARLSEEDSLPDLHSDEKNVLRRNGSSTGFKLL